MRLIEIKQCINIAFENFNPKYSNNGGNYYIDNVLSIKKALKALSRAGFISLDIDILKDINASVTNRLILSSSQDSAYQSLFSKIQYTINLLHEWAQSYISLDENETTINIKLPIIDTLKDFAASGTIIQKAFSRIISEFGGELKVKQFDYGSSWLILEANDVETVKFIGALVSGGWCIAKSAVYLIKSYLEIQSMGLDNQLKKIEIEKLERDVIKKKAEEKAKELNEEYFKHKESTDTDINERIDRIAASLVEIVKILKGGGEICPALGSKSNLKDAFPDYKEKLIPYAKIELLETKGADSTANNALKKDDKFLNSKNNINKIPDDKNNQEIVAAAVVHKNGKFLITERAHPEGKFKYGFPAGKLDKNRVNEEDYIKQRLVEECFAETNIRIKPAYKISERVHPDTGVRIIYWACDFVSGVKRIKDKKELKSVEWMTQEEIFEFCETDLCKDVKIYMGNID